MSTQNVALPIVNPSDAPCVDVHYEWCQYALWLSGRYGYANVDGHELHLSSDLVRDLMDWGDREDALFNPDDPPSSGSTEGYLENGFELAKRVRAELPAEWVVTTIDPVTRSKVVLNKGAEGEGQPAEHQPA